MVFDIAGPEEDSRYDRAERIAWWDQNVLNESKVMVIGAGAIGNELLKNLGLLGIGTIVIVDMDVIERSNLARCVLFREGDDKKNKAKVAAKRLKDLNPYIKTIAIDDDVVWGVGQGIFRRMDVVAGAVDNRLARYFINRNCSMFGIPFIDSGIQELDAIVSAFKSPESACYECSLYEDEYRLLTDKYPCFGLLSEEIVEWKTPTVATTSSIISGVQVQEIIKMLHIMKNKILPKSVKLLLGKEFRYNGRLLDGSLFEIPKREGCFNQFCNQIVKCEDLIELPNLTRDNTVNELYEEITNNFGKVDSISLGIQILTKGKCNNCQMRKNFFIPEKSVTENQTKCPKCKIKLNLETTSIIPKSELTLREMNIPPVYIFQAVSGKSMKYFEITGDLKDKAFII